MKERTSETRLFLSFFRKKHGRPFTPGRRSGGGGSHRVMQRGTDVSGVAPNFKVFSIVKDGVLKDAVIEMRSKEKRQSLTMIPVSSHALYSTASLRWIVS